MLFGQNTVPPTLMIKSNSSPQQRAVEVALLLKECWSDYKQENLVAIVSSLMANYNQWSIQTLFFTFKLTNGLMDGSYLQPLMTPNVFNDKINASS